MSAVGHALRRLSHGIMLVGCGVVWNAALAQESPSIKSGREYWSVPNRCTNCHTAGATPQNAVANPINLASPWMNSPDVFGTRLTSPPPNPSPAQMTLLAGSDINRVNVHKYFQAVRDTDIVPVMSPAPLLTTILKRSESTFELTLRNYREASLSYVVTVGGDTFSEFSLENLSTPPTCSAASSTTGAAPTSCTISGTVVFQPKAAGGVGPRLNAKLVVTPTFLPAATAMQPSAATSGSREFAITANVVEAFVISANPPGLVRRYTTSASSPTRSEKISVTDKAGDPIKVCLLPVAGPFNGFPDPPDPMKPRAYSISASGSSPIGNNCLQFPQAPPNTVSPISTRPLEFDILFNPGMITGPLFAMLEVQQVATAGLVVSMELRGNEGPVLFVQEEQLFRGESGSAEVGGLNEQTLEVFSRGNEALEFGPSPFTISDGQSDAAGMCLKNPVTPAANTGRYTIVSDTCTSATLLAFATPATDQMKCVVTLRFNPQATGQRCAVLSIKSKLPTGPQAVVVLEGTGFLGPRLVVLEAPTSQATTLDFTSQQLQGITYPSKTLTLTNGATPGRDNLEVVLPPAGAVPGFRLTPGPGCTLLAPFIANAAPPPPGSPTCTLAVAFVPTELRPYTGSFDIVTRAQGMTGADKTFRVNVVGTGSNVAPPLSWENEQGMPIAALGFGRVEAGQPCPSSCEASAYLRNSGDGSARLDLVNAVGLDGTSFTARKQGCSTDGFIARGDRCRVVVTFNPSTAGTKTASLQAASTGNGPPTLTLTGQFIAGSLAPQLTLSQSSPFDETRVGSTSVPVEFLLANTGTGSFALRVLEFKVSGPFALAGTSCPPLPFALDSGRGCKVSLTFTPSDGGSASGMFEVVSDASATASSSALSAKAEGEADLSSGGCSISGGSRLIDPTLWVLALFAAVALAYRRRAQRPRKSGR